VNNALQYGMVDSCGALLTFFRGITEFWLTGRRIRVLRNCKPIIEKWIVRIVDSKICRTQQTQRKYSTPLNVKEKQISSEKVGLTIRCF